MNLIENFLVFYLVILKIYCHANVLDAGTYDFIIVGSGPGGSVVANRLSEITNWKILLLEAGKEESFLTDIPLVAPFLHITDYNWGYKTEPSDYYCQAMVDKKCNWPRGKALGGSSVINFMIYTRGSKEDYDEWEKLGNKGWSYQDVLPYFLKSENSRLKYQNKKYHSYGGYLDVANIPYATKLRDSFLKSAKEFGYLINDYNAESLMGFSPAQTNIRNGRRVSASRAFMDPIRYIRENLYISTYSQVTKIIIDQKTHKTKGVKFRKNNKDYIAKAKKEVILSAGAINSPQLLMLSGIGPKEHLESHGIPVIEDLPVGYNLQDHVSMAALTFLVNESVTIVEPRVATNLRNTFDYLFRGSGPLTIPSGAEALAFVDTKTVLEPEKGRNYSTYPDIELFLGSGSLTGDISGGMRTLLGLTDEFYNQVFANYTGYDGFSIVPILMRPKSIGRVMLRSSNPFVWPSLYANYYSHQDDVDAMVRGIKAAIKISKSRAFKKFSPNLLPIPFPGCKNIKFNTDDYWSCVVKQVSTTLGHFVGTCKMSPRSNFGVVDSRLKVYGITGLRIVDASIMPNIIAGHTCAPVYMIGEKASDMIKEDWNAFYTKTYNNNNNNIFYNNKLF